MKIFRHNENNNLYTITHLIKDIKHLNHNEFAGVYAHPYNWQGPEVVFRSKDEEQCMLFIENNFKVVSEI